VEWFAVVYRQRSDVDRCRGQSGVEVDHVNVGGWGEPDRCVYRDENDGALVMLDLSLAGPVSTTPFADALLVSLAVSVTAGAVVARFVRRVP
jgi:hypothetical protein